jgi:hypothetical protein
MFENIIAAPKAGERTEGVRKIAARFVQNITKQVPPVPQLHITRSPACHEVAACSAEQNAAYSEREPKLPLAAP